MVYIHGESYESGTGNAYDGSVLSSYGDVIVVTLNYRLGVLGFLSTEEVSAMGNYALMDITQALLWLRENIASFNGDPQKVTLFGHGHGSAIVNLLMLSPFVMEGKANFFHRAILQSGSALATWAVSYDPSWCTQRLALSVNCSRHVTNTNALVECLRERSYEELVNAPAQEPKYYSCFAPSVDQYTMLPVEVRKLLQKKRSKFAQVPVMFGITKNEAYSYLKPQEARQGLSKARKTQILRTYVQNVFRYHRQKIYEILDHHYTDWSHESDPISNRNNVLELISDGQYVAPLVEMADFHAETADTYLYSFSHSTQSAGLGEAEDIQGIHGDELPYVFGSPLVNGSSPFPASFTDAERLLSETMMTYWTNFAKSGNPNEPRNRTSFQRNERHRRSVNLKWPKYEAETKEYMSISPRPSVQHHYRAEKLALWLNLIPKIDKDDGSEKGSHQLDNSDNSSTFDDYQKLLSSNLDNTIFPSPPPMPPVSPTPSDRSTTQGKGHHGGITSQDGSPVGHRPGAGRRGEPSVDNPQHPKFSGDSNNPVVTPEVDGAGASGITKDPADSDGKAAETGKASTSGVPLSMVVAIGGSLLLINLLIFAGLCYQRERIRKMRRLEKPVLPPPELDYDEDEEHGAAAELVPANHHNSHKMLAGAGTVSANGSPSTAARRTTASLASAGAGPECMSLISAGGSSSGGGHHHRGPSPHRSNGGYHQHGNTHVHNPSPQPFGDDIKEIGAGSGGPSRRSMPYMTRGTPPRLSSIDSSSSSAVGSGGGGGGGVSEVGGGRSFVPVTSGAYSTVPTHASSPVHRPQSSVSPPPYTGVGESGNLGGGSRISDAAGLSGTGTYVNSQIHPATISEVIVNHKPADIHSRVVPSMAGSHLTGSGNGHGGARTGPLPMTTFGVGAGSGLAGQGRPGLSSSLSDRSSPGVPSEACSNTSTPAAIGSSSSGAGGGAGSDPVYKKINKSGQNNAVTIV
ncbi:neuroligin 4 [Elysia marginata]|uniref:Neuroligin 4 n=1 Tax=Elysia marginata TaxID=1093978 RepID=A0AAV4JGN7_9GAST|nr:neuroligin 4 [Elysia marginata]